MLCIYNRPIVQRDVCVAECEHGHGFERKLYALNRNGSCPACSRNEKQREIELSFGKKAAEWGFKYISGYTDKKSQVEIECLSCNHIFHVQAETLVKNKRCPACGRQCADFKRIKKRTLDSVALDNGFTIVDRAPGRNGISLFKCKNGHEFRKDNHRFMGAPTCVSCNKEKRSSESDSMFRGRLVSHGYKILSDDKISSSGSIFTVECSSGHIFNGSIAGMHPHYGCPVCKGEKTSKEKRLSLDEVKENLKSVGIKYISGEYINNRSIIEVECVAKGHKITGKSYGEICTSNKGCIKCRASEIQSRGEKEVFEFVKSICKDAEHSNRTILRPREIDILIPSKKIGIEYDGMFWHSDRMQPDKKYHLKKTQDAQKKGYKLIHIFESEWNTKKEIVKDILRVKLGAGKRIFARKTVLRSVQKDEEKRFFNDNHLQGFAGSSFCYGLYFGDELVIAASFAKNRFGGASDYELVRLATKGDYVVVGGFSKIIKHFRSQHEGKSLLSFCDVRYSGLDHDGTGYSAVGFNYSHLSSPNYFYFKPGDPFTLSSRQKFQKHRLKSKLNRFDSTKTEVENMHDNGYARIFDCGNMVFML